MVVRGRRPLSPAIVLLAGAALIPGPADNASSLPLTLQLGALYGSTALSPPPTAPLAFGDVAPLEFLPPAALPATAGLALSLPSDFSWTAPPLAPALVPGPTTDGGAAPPFAADGGPTAPAVALPVGAGAVRSACAPVVQQLQAAGRYWNAVSVGAPPVRLSPPPRAIAPLVDPIRGPGGDRTNVSAPGPAGAWCRPPPVPFAESSPLAGRGFWLPVAVALFGVTVFWLSRGLRMPS